MKTLAQIFEKCTENKAGCLVWTGGTRRRYARIYSGGRIYIGSRLVMELVHGKIPEGQLVLHRCDNPPCLNPAHLFFGTHKENVQDAMLKGRMNKKRLSKKCKRGHGFTPDNTRYSNGGRVCRKCHQAYMKKYNKMRKVTAFKGVTSE
jgi:hypothetical protein